jgi:NAD(P)-dependent dehydrogenase (short-subunit alcohol dehydrogenase family)
MSSSIDLSGKVALITGGGSGIGLGAAHVLARAGARIALLGHTPKNVEEATRELRDGGHEALAVVADISEPADMDRAVAEVLQKWGRLDIVFANAGINGVWAPIEELKPEEWDKTIKTNLTGTFLTVRSTVPHLKKQGGSIIITSSVNGTRMFSNTGATAYSCSKAGQVALAKMLALELAADKVRVNVICPGWIESEIEDNTEKRNVDKVKPAVEFPEGAVPLKGGAPGTAEQVGDVVLFLASDLSSHVTGTEIWVDGAQSLLQG